MQSLMVLLPVGLTLLFPKSGSGFGLPILRHRFMPFDHMMAFGGMMDPAMIEMLQENALDNPEFEQIKMLCEKYVSGSGQINLGDPDLEYSLINECEKWQQGKPVYVPNLVYLQKKVTANPLAAEVLNKKN